MYNLRRFSVADMMDCRTRVRSLLDDDPADLETAATRVVRFFYDSLLDDDGSRACALVRLFKTHPFGQLDGDTQAFARTIASSDTIDDDVRCLVLLGTAGAESDWNSRLTSHGHRAIPLISEKVVEGAPMISQLIRQLGVEVSTVVRPDPSLLLDANQTTYNVFHVPRAAGSPFIVAQAEFVRPYGIESVIGFGGMTVTGDLFATILFTRVPISSAVADSFKVIGLNLRLALLPFARRPLFGTSA